MNGRWRISGHRGFVTVYVLMVLAAAVLLTNSVYIETERYHQFRSQNETVRLMNWMEVLTINRIKQKMRDYKEKNEEYSLNGCSVSIRYDGSKAFITITCNGMYRYRTLEYDDVEECISAYY